MRRPSPSFQTPIAVHCRLLLITFHLTEKTRAATHKSLMRDGHRLSKLNMESVCPARVTPSDHGLGLSLTESFFLFFSLRNLTGVWFSPSSDTVSGLGMGSTMSHLAIDIIEII